MLLIYRVKYISNAYNNLYIVDSVSHDTDRMNKNSTQSIHKSQLLYKTDIKITYLYFRKTVETRINNSPSVRLRTINLK
jgi:hypothetical protein